MTTCRKADGSRRHSRLRRHRRCRATVTGSVLNGEPRNELANALRRSPEPSFIGRRSLTPSATADDTLRGCLSGAMPEATRWVPCRLTAYEFSGNNRANARLLSAATRG